MLAVPARCGHSRPGVGGNWRVTATRKSPQSRIAAATCGAGAVKHLVHGGLLQTVHVLRVLDVRACLTAGATKHKSLVTNVHKRVGTPMAAVMHLQLRSQVPCWTGDVPSGQKELRVWRCVRPRKGLLLHDIPSLRLHSARATKESVGSVFPAHQT